MGQGRIAVSIAVLVAGALAIPATSVAGSPPQQGLRAATVAPTYENPLDLRLPNGEEAASCADPDVIRGQEEGDATWYLYCTTDAIDESEQDAAGHPILHNIPMYTSIDLVHWTYAGDAFPTMPDWIPDDGFIWAPEIAYLDGQYHLYYAAPRTVVGGTAIGVATSDSPLGPWTDSGGPVVEPRGDRWQYDPEILEVGDTTYLYFGSYVGGIFVRELSADNLHADPATETRVTIDNRYEGPLVIERDGWYYLLVSATDCCRGPVTGYAVFAGRSQSPLGPFVDRSGVSLLDARVGGTPVLVQNGNRWIGTGHLDVFTDFDGQDWAIYHAVDQNDPYYEDEVGYTKRPALLDPLDWVNGWPVVRGGFGPSDDPMPGPAAQPGWVTAYEPQFIQDPRLGRNYGQLSENFSGRKLSKQWSWIRPEQAQFTIGGGALVWQTQAADLQAEGPLASVLTMPAPKGDYVVETRVSMTLPEEGCCFNYVQGGLVIYKDDGNYVKLVTASIWNTRQTEFAKRISPVPEGYPTYGNTVVGPVGDWTYLRIVHQDGRYTAFTSLDGQVWERGGTWSHDLGANPLIGLVSMGGAGFSTTFDYVTVRALK